MDKKLKEGISVQELENFGKKYQFEIFFIAYFILATFLTFFFFGPAWSIFLGGIGAILGVLMPHKIDKAIKATFRFIAKQEKITKLILGIVGLIISFFLPPIIFFVLGLMGGKSLYKSAAHSEHIDEGSGDPPVM